MTAPVHLHAGAAYYVERDEPEEAIEGVLVAVAARTGPDTRDLPLHLDTGEESVPLYAVGRLAERLGPLVGTKVQVVGKRIDQHDQGHDVEVWPATVASLAE